MNNLEKERVNILKILVKENKAVGCKMSFEDEGASLEDIVIAKNVIDKVGLELNVKIGRM